MSGSTVDPEEDPASPDVRAGEYVLGLAEPEEARALEAEAAGSPQLARAIARWEADFAPLLDLFHPVDPPPSLWTRIERSAFGATAWQVEPRSRRSGRVGQTGRLWGAGGLGFAIAAAIAAIAFIGRPSPPPASPVPVAALVPKTAGEPVIVADLLADGRLSIRAVRSLAAPAGHDYELWSLPAGAARPVALGLLASGGTVLQADRVPAGAGQILVSLEPRGGSPTGLPTGPVLWGGAYDGRG